MSTLDRRVRSPKRERSSSSQGGRGRGKKRRGPKKTKGQRRRAENDRAEKDAARQANQNTSKEKGKGKSKGEQICIGFSKGYGPCASASPGSPCKEGRKHACHVCGGNQSAKSKGCKPKVPG